MTRQFRLFLVTLTLLLVPGCRSNDNSRPGLSPEDRAALQAIADQDSLIIGKHNWDALAAQFEENGVRMPPNQPAVQGRAAIRSWLDQFPPITAFDFHLVDLEGQGGLAFMRGAWRITMKPPGATPAVSDSGKILVVLRKQADGSWRRVADAWNSDLPL